MAEYWKSTPRYWCKHCTIYVRDTKLERQNHEATAKHQGAVKRALRDLHRAHEREQRDKERARREIDRLNGVLSSASASASASASTSASASAAPSEGERRRQAQQLASLGISLPDYFRRDLAMPGDWQVVAGSRTVVRDGRAGDDSRGGSKLAGAARSRSAGKRDRDCSEEEGEEHDEEPGRAPFKKPRRWGRDSRVAGGIGHGGDHLDALLSAGLVLVKKEHVGGDDKEEGDRGQGEEEAGADDKSQLNVKSETRHDVQDPISEEPPFDNTHLQTDDMHLVAASAEAAGTPTVTFRKRKAKNIRQR